MDAEQDNDLEPSLPLLAHVRTLCQDPHHTQGDADADYAGADADVEEEEEAILSENQHSHHASTPPSSIFISTYLLHIFISICFIFCRLSPQFLSRLFMTLRC